MRVFTSKSDRGHPKEEFCQIPIYIDPTKLRPKTPNNKKMSLAESSQEISYLGTWVYYYQESHHQDHLLLKELSKSLYLETAKVYYLLRVL